MDELRIDRIARCLAQVRLTRRSGFLAGGVGLTATVLSAVGLAAREFEADGFRLTAGAIPAVQSTPDAEVAATPTAANELNIDGAWLCNQVFALCTTAPCVLSTSDPTVANCDCVVIDAYSVGFKSCSERAQAGNNLVSNFSAVNVNSAFAVMTCPENAPWANCLDMPCEIDSLNPAQATCQCQIVETGPSLTWGGGCDTGTCTSVIWSAAPPTYLGLAQYEEGLKQVNQEVTFPAACPAATPVVSPASATPSA